MAAAETIGLPGVVKPVMSSSGKGQSVARTRRSSAAPGTMPSPTCAATGRG